MKGRRGRGAGFERHVGGAAQLNYPSCWVSSSPSRQDFFTFLASHEAKHWFTLRDISSIPVRTATKRKLSILMVFVRD